MKRFDDEVIRNEKMFWIKLKYIHHNPVKAGLVNKPEDYKYSSARNYILDDHSILKVDTDYAGIEIPETMQGESIRKILYNKKHPWRSDFLFEHLFEYKTIPRSEGVVTKDWKYTRFIDRESGYEWMYNLKVDPKEKLNLAEDKQYSNEKVRMIKRFKELVEQSK